MSTATAFPAALQDRFKPVRLLGQGGFGSVWLAEQTALKRPVALKALHPGLVDTDEQVQRFRDEARLTASIRHPGVVTLLDHGVDDGVPWMAFEYVEGASLRTWVERGKTPWRRALQVGLAVAQALEEARRGGIVHRDVKPDNILESVEGNYKLADFGIAKWSGNSTQTAAGIMLGTPAYLSPNQVKGHLPAHQSDLYALGVTLFELITGTTPFVEDNPILMLERHISQTPPPVRQLAPDVPQEVELLLKKLLAKDREERFDTAAELAERLTAILERPSRPSARTTQVARRGDAPPAPSRGMRHALLGAAAVLGLGALAVGMRAPVTPTPPASASAAPVAMNAAANTALDALEARALRVYHAAEELLRTAPEASEMVVGGSGLGVAGPRLDRAGMLIGECANLVSATLDHRGPADDRLVAVHAAGVLACEATQQIFQQAQLASALVNVPALDSVAAVQRLRSMHSALVEAAPGPDAYRQAMITDLAPIVAALAGPSHDAQRQPDDRVRTRESAIATLSATPESLRTLGGIVILRLSAANMWRDVTSWLPAENRAGAKVTEQLLRQLRAAAATLPACVAAAARERDPARVDHALRPLFRCLVWLSVAVDHTPADVRTGLDGAAQLADLYGDRWTRPPLHWQVRLGAHFLNDHLAVLPDPRYDRLRAIHDAAVKR